MQLVKNPAGFRQTLKTLDSGATKSIVIAINDEYADGRDVSWLWDVDFRRVRSATRRALSTRAHGPPIWRCACATTRSRSAVEAGLEAAAATQCAAVAPEEEVVVFWTYTAMWALHAILLRIGAPGTMGSVITWPICIPER